MVSRVSLPKRKIILCHRGGDMMVFDFSNKHEVAMYFDLFATNLSRIIREYLRPGDRFVDCGANIGYFTFSASSVVGSKGRVVSIDANPYCIERINESKTLGGYTNIDIIPCAIGDGDGDIEFNVADDPMYSSLVNVDELGFTSTKSTISVPLRKMDDIFHDQKIGKRVRLLKLDVEGAEIDVLRGVENSINSKVIDYIFVEADDKQIRLRGQDRSELFDLLGARGFKLDKQFGERVFLYKADV